MPFSGTCLLDREKQVTSAAMMPQLAGSCERRRSWALGVGPAQSRTRGLQMSLLEDRPPGRGRATPSLHRPSCVQVSLTLRPLSWGLAMGWGVGGIPQGCPRLWGAVTREGHQGPNQWQ